MTRSIRIYTREWSSLDAYAQDIDPDDTYDDSYDHDPTYDSEPVDWAVDLLRELGLIAPSSSPSWTPGTWYGQADGVRTYIGSGRSFEHSARLAGFTEEEERAIYDLATLREQIEED